jgi:hypothetical protein
MVSDYLDYNTPGIYHNGVAYLGVKGFKNLN